MNWQQRVSLGKACLETYDSDGAWYNFNVALDEQHVHQPAPIDIAEALRLSAKAAFNLGRIEKAEQRLHEAVKVSDQIAARDLQAFCLTDLGEVLMWRGEYHESIGVLGAAVSLLDGLPFNTSAYAHNLLLQGEALLAIGQVDHAVAFVSAAIKLAEVRGGGGSCNSLLTRAWCVQAQLLIMTGQSHAAEHAVIEAFTHAQHLNEADIAWTYLGLALLRLAQARTEAN